MKRVIKWEYDRGSWQYDLFCLLIIAFIFLTPKTWFNNARTLATQGYVEAVQTQYNRPDQNK
jgi:hypothetical protein